MHYSTKLEASSTRVQPWGAPLHRNLNAMAGGQRRWLLTWSSARSIDRIRAYRGIRVATVDLNDGFDRKWI